MHHFWRVLNGASNKKTPLDFPLGIPSSNSLQIPAPPLSIIPYNKLFLKPRLRRSEKTNEVLEYSRFSYVAASQLWPIPRSGPKTDGRTHGKKGRIYNRVWLIQMVVTRKRYDIFIWCDGCRAEYYSCPLTHLFPIICSTIYAVERRNNVTAGSVPAILL